MPDATPIRGLFRRAPRTQVEQILAKALGLVAEGKTLMEVASRGGQSSAKAFAMPCADVIAEANARLDRLDGLAKRKTYSFFARNGTGGGNDNP